MKIFQKGFNFGQDGPGNRLVYHLQGCNMRCIWCSNPEGMSWNGGKEYSVEVILEECLRSRMMFYSGGGVTFTGGEVTVQTDELLELLKGLKAVGIHTVIETNGTSPRLGELLPYLDYLIMDFKHYDSEVLRHYAGVGNQQIKKNYEEICRQNRQVHIRIPLIKGINTDNPEGFATYLASVENPSAVYEFLAYHEYGKDKWTEEYQVQDGFVSPELVQQFEDVFQSYGLRVIRT